MKKYLYILFATSLFASCNTDNLFDDYLNERGYEFKETNLSIIEVLGSADSWNEYYAERYFFTKPDGKGEVYKPDTDYGQDSTLGEPAIKFSATSDKLRFFYTDTTIPYFKHYVDFPIIEVSNERIVYLTYTGKEFSWKIVKYDEDKIIIESEHIGYYTKTDKDYPYCRTILHKQASSQENWEDEYLSTDEYAEAQKQYYYELKKQQLKNYWESKSPEEIEELIAKELESGDKTIKELEEFFKEVCPELYESTIKYILEKFK